MCGCILCAYGRGLWYVCSLVCVCVRCGGGGGGGGGIGGGGGGGVQWFMCIMEIVVVYVHVCLWSVMYMCVRCVWGNSLSLRILRPIDI